MTYRITRYHDICAGHRVAGHENKCAHLHGHNYRFYFTVEPDLFLDDIGRTIDFSVVKERLCQWLEDNWDHRMLIWEGDPMAADIKALDPATVIVPFNPTAENIASHMVRVVAPKQFEDLHVTLSKCVVQETRKCSAEYEYGDF